MKMTKFTLQRLALTATDLPELEGNYLAVPHNHGAEICHALEAVSELLEKYNKLVLITAKASCYPRAIKHGFMQYCRRYQKNFSILGSGRPEIPTPGTAYFILDDKDLAKLLEVGKALGYRIGLDLGILSFEDNPLKKFVGLTVLTTSFCATGVHDPLFCKHPQLQKSRCTAKVIRRESL